MLFVNMAKATLMSLLYFLATMLLLFADVNGIKITMLHMHGGSHAMITDVMAQELAARGHEVTQCRPSNETEAGKISKGGNSAFQILHFYQGYEDRAETEIFKACASASERTMSDEYKFYIGNMILESRICNNLLSIHEPMSAIKEADLLISENILFCSGLIAKKFNKKWIAISPSTYSELNSNLNAVYLNPSLQPCMQSGLTHEMSFLQRVQNFLFHFMFKNMMPHALKSAFRNVSLQHNLTHLDLFHELSSAEMIIGNCDFAVDHAYPQLPNNICVGPLLAKPGKKLPPKFENYMNTSKHGVVMVAFGTKFGVHNEKFIRAMAGAFKKLKEDVLWQMKDKPKITLPSNVRTVKWLPQNDLLAHPNLKLFVSHVGQSSLMEAGYHGVPILAVPQAIDQGGNAKLVSHRMKTGESLDIHSADEREWFNKIKMILTNSSYRTNALKVSRRLRSKTRSPREHAADLIQYVIDNECDVSHLKSNGHKLPWHVVNLLDVYSFLATMLIIVIFILYTISKKVMFIALRRKVKSE